MRLILAALLLVAACSKKDDAPKPADKPAGDKPVAAEKPAPGTPVVEVVPAKIKEATNVADLGKLPVDSEIVAGVNVAQIQTSALWKDIFAPQLLTGEVKRQLEDFQQKCGLDPLAVIKTATIGLKGSTGVVVVHGPDKAKVVACAQKMKADKDAKVDVTIDGDVTILSPKIGGVPVAFMFTSDTDAVIVIGPKADAAGVKAAVGSSGGLAASGAFVDMYNRVETEKALWMLVNGKLDQFQGLAALGIKPTHVFGSLDVATGLDLDLRMRLASADQATQSAAMMKSQLGSAAGMLKIDKLDATSDGRDLKISILVTQANIPGMLKALQGFGMLGGGMGGRP